VLLGQVVVIELALRHREMVRLVPRAAGEQTNGRGIRWQVATWHDEVAGELAREAYLEIHWRHVQLLADEVSPDRHFVDVDRNILDAVAAASQCCRRHGIPIQVFVTG
jgi:hypothetical protein